MSYASLADKLGISIHRVRNAIDRLKKTGEITIRRYRNFQVITIVNYDKYQSQHYQPQSFEKKAHRHTSGKLGADLGHTSGTPRATIKEFNNSIINNLNTNEILEEVIYTISLSISDNYNVDEVVFSVEDEPVYKSVLKIYC